MENEEDHKGPEAKSKYLRAPLPSKNEAYQIQKQKPLPDIKLPDKEAGMSNTVYKKLLNVAVDEIQKRKDPTNQGEKKWAAGTKPSQIGFK